MSAVPNDERVEHEWIDLPWFDGPPPWWKPAARGIDVIDAKDLDATTLKRDYWARNRPLLIKNAVKHMDAYDKWRSMEYLRENTDNHNVIAFNRPVVEWSPPIRDEVALCGVSLRDPEAVDVLPLHDFMDRLTTKTDPPIWLYATPFPKLNSEVEHVPPQPPPTDPGVHEKWAKLETRYPLARVANDLGVFPYVPKGGRARVYSPWRAFFYRKSFTDWHAHPADAHIMCQFRGSKYVNLVPPQEGWDVLAPLIKGARNSFNATREEHPKFFELDPYRVVVEEGDALYIPIFWWHAVAPCDDDWGLTGAHTWGSPPHVNADPHFGINEALWEYSDTLQRAMLLAGRGLVAGYRAYSRATKGHSKNWDWR